METADGQRYLLSVFRNAGRKVQLNAILFNLPISVQVAPPQVGIDRYLNRFAGSTFPANQVYYDPTTPEVYELSGFLRYVDRHRHSPLVRRLAIPKCVRIKVTERDVASQGGAKFVGAVHF